jgi:hypothetical protein
MPEAKEVIPNAQHEPTDIGSGFIWGAVAVCLSTLLACALLVFWLYPESRLDRSLEMPLPLYPEPRLQPNPQADMQQFYAQEMEGLDGTGWVDKSRGVARIPITEAMQEVAREGIAGWPEDRRGSP